MSDSSVEGSAEGQSQSVARIVVLLLVLLAAGCAGVEHTPPSEPAQTGATQGGAAAVEPRGRPATLPTTRSTGQSLTHTDSPGAKVSATVSASPAAIHHLRKKESAAPALETQQASPPLD